MKYLDFSNSDLVQFNSDDVPKQYLNTITEIKLQNNKLSKIDISDLVMPKLQKVYLDNNKFTSIGFVKVPKNVKVLHLQNNRIESMVGLSEYQYLQSLYLDNNLISSIKGIIGSESLKYLSTLSLNHNKIGGDGLVGISELKSLIILNLKCNQLDQVPSDLPLGVGYLNLDNNKISKIENLNGLSQLKTLILSRNQISEIVGLESQSNLISLCLSHNMLKSIDSEYFMGLSNLSLLYLDSNYISDYVELNKLKHKGNIRTIYFYGQKKINVDIGVQVHEKQSLYSYLKGLFI